MGRSVGFSALEWGQSDFYQQNFPGLKYDWQVGPGILCTDLRHFDNPMFRSIWRGATQIFNQ
ncbi:hypothetical protein ELQ88_12750 [Pseudomonas sp. MPC6]|nr:hypothetical protein BZ163_30550 [Pseudomonas sp. VI4.1]QCY11597.1 hypothetical protein ELQ88_12750 [Pseudomonas sp. MPC6]